MKPNTSLLASAIALFVLASCNEDSHDHGHHDHEHGDGEHHDHDHGDHDHGSSITLGPNGGRLLEGTDPSVELLVMDDRKVQLTLVGDDGKVIVPGTEVVTLTTGDRSAPTKLAFAVEGNAFISNAALPEGDDLATVIDLKATPDATAKYARVQLNLKDCPTCDSLEYVCQCDHH